VLQTLILTDKGFFLNPLLQSSRSKRDYPIESGKAVVQKAETWVSKKNIYLDKFRLKKEDLSTC
jgi:hypothetical protein